MTPNPVFMKSQHSSESRSSRFDIIQGALCRKDTNLVSRMKRLGFIFSLFGLQRTVGCS